VPGDRVTLGTTLGYVDARLTADEPGIGLNPGVEFVRDGARLPLSSRFNAALTADYNQPLTAQSKLEAGVSYRYATDLWTYVPGVSYAVLERQPRPLDLYAGLRFNQVNARLYARNVFNSEPSIERLFYPPPGQPGLASPYTFFQSLEYTPIQPRTIGISVDVSF
jgi:hypothetical protein